MRPRFDETSREDVYASTLIHRIPWPGAGFTANACGLLGEPTPACLSLEDRAQGRWSDLSILETASRETLLAGLARSQSFTADLRLRARGHERPIELRCAAYWGATRGEYLCRVVESTDLHAARDASRRRRGLMQEMLANLPLLVIEFSPWPESRCTFAGGDLMALVQMPGVQPLGCEAVKLLGAQRLESLALHDQVTSNSGTARTFLWRIVDERGNERVLEGELRAIVDTQGRLRSHVIGAMETTDHHHTMAALKASEERLRRFVVASSDGILIHAGGCILDANPAACRLLSTTVEALRQRHFHELIAPEDRERYLALSERESHEILDCGLIDARGERIAVELIGRTVRRHGQGLRMAIVRDVRDRVEARARIVELIDDLRAQRDRAEAADRAKSVFLAAASHDLRQPVHALGLFLSGLEETVRSAKATTVALAEPTRRMRQSLNVLSRLLNSLLDVSRLEANAVVVDRQSVALSTLLSDLELDFVEAAQNKGLRIHVIPGNAWVHTDPLILQRILGNLMSNAVRYTRRGRIVVGARPRGGAVEIQVWDTGIGIASDQLEAIFSAFYQVNPSAAPPGEPRGLGLGLSIVQRLAGLLGAPLKVRSVVGRGSMFSITVPRGEGAPLVAALPSQARSLNTSGTRAVARRRVLVIDDDVLVLTGMEQLLRAWGHEVWCASSADQAIVLAVKYAAEIDLVLTDYHLGDEVRAPQFIEVIRSSLARPVPVHVCTADLSLRVAHELRELGLSVWHKPLREDDLRHLFDGTRP